MALVGAVSDRRFVSVILPGTFAAVVALCFWLGGPQRALDITMNSGLNGLNVYSVEGLLLLLWALAAVAMCGLLLNALSLLSEHVFARQIDYLVGWFRGDFDKDSAKNWAVMIYGSPDQASQKSWADMMYDASLRVRSSRHEVWKNIEWLRGVVIMFRSCALLALLVPIGLICQHDWLAVLVSLGIALVLFLLYLQALQYMLLTMGREYERQCHECYRRLYSAASPHD